MANPTASGEGATPNPDPGATPIAATGATPAAMTAEQMQAEIKRLTETLDATRKESIQHRTKLTAFEKAQADADAAKLDDVQRAAKRAEEAEAALKEARQQIAAHNIYKLAAAMNFNNPDLATRLVALDADASDTDITKALQALAQSDPYLIKAADSAPPAAAPRQAPSNPPRGTTNGPPPSVYDPANPPTLGAIFKKQ